MSDQPFETVVDLLHYRLEQSADRDAMYGRRAPGDWYTLTWREVGERTRKIAGGLQALGIAKGDRVSILSLTRPEWVVIDLGILCAGACTTTIYTSNTADECAYILEDSGSAYCFVENAEQADKMTEVRDRLGHVKAVIWIDGEPPSSNDWMLSLAELERRGEEWLAANPGGYEATCSAVGPEDLATVIYTSGTTGRPKGVMLTHANWAYEAWAIREMDLLRPDDVQYLFLPLAHSFAKVLGVGFIATATPTAVDGDVDALLENLGHVRPTVMAAVPRVFEKVYNKVVSGAKEAGGLKYKIFLWAVEVGKEVSVLRQRGEDASGLLALKHKLADKLVYSKLKDRFGGRIRYFVSGGAPLAREIAEFFHAADLLVLEGYGLTETSAAAFINRSENYKFGTVGQPVPGTEVRIAEDGEILIKGGGIMRGYYHRPDDTAEVLEDGWLHSGDIGNVDGDGFLTITDRKKDIIVTAGGKNVAPQYVENLLKTGSRFISQVVMVGDRRPYCMALVTINEETVGAWAQEQGIAFDGYADLASKPEVEKLVWADVEAVNGELASYEQIKKIRLLDHEFTTETGELTPKMSIKRKVVETRHADLIESSYGSTVEAM